MLDLEKTENINIKFFYVGYKISENYPLLNIKLDGNKTILIFVT